MTSCNFIRAICRQPPPELVAAIVAAYHQQTTQGSEEKKEVQIIVVERREVVRSTRSWWRILVETFGLIAAVLSGLYWRWLGIWVLLRDPVIIEVSS